jgi:uncharacterized membrane protein YphA (DoxX/SURF4 family)
MNITFSLPRVFRVALGLLFILLGYNNIMPFLPQETMDLPARYFLGFVGTYEHSQSVLMMLQILCGTLLFINIAVPLCVIAVFPIIVNMLAFHIETSQHLYTVGGIASIYFIYLALTIKKFSFLLEGNKE